MMGRTRPSRVPALPQEKVQEMQGLTLSGTGVDHARELPYAGVAGEDREDVGPPYLAGAPSKV